MRGNETAERFTTEARRHGGRGDAPRSLSCLPFRSSKVEVRLNSRVTTPPPCLRASVVNLLLFAVAVLATGTTRQADADDGRKKTTLAASVATGFPLAAHRVLDVDRDGKADVVAVGERGEVRVWRHDAATGSLGAKPAGSLVLRFPDRTLLAVADLLGGGAAPQLVEMTKDGVFLHRVEKDGSWSRAQELVAPRAKLPIRIGRPTFADIARDVNGDGKADLVQFAQTRGKVYVLLTP